MSFAASTRSDLPVWVISTEALPPAAVLIVAKIS
jgi:hypothetical protein